VLPAIAEFHRKGCQDSCEVGGGLKDWGHSLTSASSEVGGTEEPPPCAGGRDTEKVSRRTP